MTNGEKMISAFPNGEVRKFEKGVVFSTGGWCHAYAEEWWNAECEEPTTKNNLGVDAVSRKAVHDMLENLPVTVENKWFNWLQKACMRLAELPSVTQEPRKGHWLGDSAGYKCDICGHDLLEIAHSIDYIDFTKPHYCPNCGADMREVEE